MDRGYEVILTAGAVLLAVMILFCLIRAIKGPRITDRIVSINMIGTMTIMIIAILAVYKGENYLVDVCLIYAMISFLAVIVLTKVYMGVHREQEAEKEAAENAVSVSDDRNAQRRNGKAAGKRSGLRGRKSGGSGKADDRTGGDSGKADDRTGGGRGKADDRTGGDCGKADDRTGGGRGMEDVLRDTADGTAETGMPGPGSGDGNGGSGSTEEKGKEREHG